MIKYAIVGNIASGKSEAEKILLKYGKKVLDTDEAAHELLDEQKDVILREFAGFDIVENGKISRQKLGKTVFSDNDLKQRLENILHPLIKIKIEQFFKENANEEMVFVAVPLLFESGMQDLFDKIIFIYTNDSIRLKRLILRDKYNEEYAKIRMDSQVSQDEKVLKSDFVVYNNTSLADLEKEIKALIL